MDGVFFLIEYLSIITSPVQHQPLHSLVVTFNLFPLSTIHARTEIL